MVSKNNLCSYSLKGLYRQPRIMGFAPGDSMNDFKKIELDLFDSLGCLEISDFRNGSEIIKEGKTDFLGDGKFSRFTK